MKLVALVRDDDKVERFLEHLGEPTDAPARAPARAPPYKSGVIRRITTGDLAVA